MMTLSTNVRGGALSQNGVSRKAQKLEWQTLVHDDVGHMLQLHERPLVPRQDVARGDRA